MSTNLLKRSQVALEDTWDLTTIFKDDQAWEAAFSQVEKEYPKIDQYKDNFTKDAKSLLELLKFTEDIQLKVSHLYVYSHLQSDTDVSNSKYQAMQSRAVGLATKVSTDFAFINPSILAADEQRIMQFIEEDKELNVYKHFFQDIFKNRKYILSNKEESILAAASQTLSSFEDIYSVYTNSEMKMPLVTNDEGKKITLSYGRYNVLRESANKEVRREAFMGMHNTYADSKNTLANILTGKIKAHNFNAAVRGFDSARHAALFSNNVPESVYDALLSTVNDNIDAMHKYVEVRKSILNLEEINMYDLYTPLVGDIDLKFTKEDAKKIILEALKPLGSEYVEVVKQAFDERWMDLVENQHKRSGAYSSGTYGTNPYILMNWQDSLDNVYTLAHELGHSLHSYYTRKYQPQVYGNYSIFVAEVASTTNEQLLTDYFLKKYDDKNIRAYILNHYLDGVKGTVFRQTQFAEFEHLLHQSDQKGIALTGEYLTEAYFEMNKKYYGEVMTYDKEIGYEWALIPHFYYNYYVYQYATGFSAASALSERILSKDQDKIDAYLDFLKSGSSDYPIEVLKKAGVDMNSPSPIQETLTIFRERLEELESLLK
ncbi:MAG TPA: oligoendopeptidase F [Erysipelotrichaceae bacterium]|nr:oligoendopeptidase F [Erysipelotrichaceae bacterium]